jgi:hypothetical protein
VNNPDHISESLEILKILKFGSGMEKKSGLGRNPLPCEFCAGESPSFLKILYTVLFFATCSLTCSFIPDSEGFHRDLSLNGEKVSFECRTTSVAVRLTELMALADINNRPQVSYFSPIIYQQCWGSVTF